MSIAATIRLPFVASAYPFLEALRLELSSLLNFNIQVAKVQLELLKETPLFPTVRGRNGGIVLRTVKKCGRHCEMVHSPDVCPLCTRMCAHQSCMSHLRTLVLRDS